MLGIAIACFGKMYYLNSICFVCLCDTGKLSAVFIKEKPNEIFTQVKYALPELTILNAENPIYICSSCHTTLRSFSMFKKKCLDNYSRLNNYKHILQGSNDTPDQSISELQIRVIKYKPLVKCDNDNHLNIKEEHEGAVLSWEEELDQKSEVDHNIDIKEESLATEDNADRAFYQQLVESESVSVDEPDGGLSVTNADNHALDKDASKYNADTDSQEFECSMCSEMFTDRLLFDTHLNKHTEIRESIKSYECSICKKQFLRNESLKTHIKTHSDADSTSSDSGDELKNQDTSNKRRYKCNECHKTFTKSSLLEIHNRVHTGVRPFKCQTCMKTFIQAAHLKRHTLTHTGERPHECDVCHKTFNTKSNLIAHKRIHDNVRPYQCTLCDQTFTWSSSLTRHKRAHTGEKPHQCHMCAYKCTQAGSLKKHIRTHTGEKPYACQHCQKTFTDLNNLYRHKRIKHRNEES